MANNPQLENKCHLCKYETLTPYGNRPVCMSTGKLRFIDEMEVEVCPVFAKSAIVYRTAVTQFA